MNDELWTIEQTAEYLGMSKPALAQLRYSGKGPRYFAPTPKVIRYRRTQVDSWIEASARTSTALAA